MMDMSKLAISSDQKIRIEERERGKAVNVAFFYQSCFGRSGLRLAKSCPGRDTRGRFVKIRIVFPESL